MTVNGGGGADKIRANRGRDTIDGGAGPDVIDGGFGDDTITGGPGADVIVADETGGCGVFICNVFGNDTVLVRDGEMDSVTCGLGADRVVADANDVVAGDCETVERPTTTGKTTDTTKTTGTTQTTGTRAASTLTVKGKASIRSLRARGLRIEVSCARKCTVTATLKLRRATMATGRGSRASAGRAQVTLRPTRRGKARLRRLRGGKMTLAATVKETGKQPRTLRKTLVFKR